MQRNIADFLNFKKAKLGITFNSTTGTASASFSITLNWEDSDAKIQFIKKSSVHTVFKANTGL